MPSFENRMIEKLLHDLDRNISILEVGSGYCQKTDFLFLQRLTGLSAGNLSVHLSKLEEATLVKTEKKIVAKRTQTHVYITEEGHEAITQYWKKIETLRNNAENWQLEN